MQTFSTYVMKKCIENAKKYAGYTITNPLVGAAIVKDGDIIAYGAHEAYGQAHAEVNAIKNANGNTEGAELYVTLEPCSTFGKTPPCTQAIIDAGIKKVYVGVLDPNPNNMLNGIKALKNAGIAVEIGVELNECANLIEDFTKTIIHKMPYVTLKIASSIDGKVATKTGNSKWITGDISRNHVHQMRAESSAILTGIGTVLVDNPMLNVRHINASRQPIRVVLDTQCRLPINSNIVATSSQIQTIVYTADGADKARIEQLKDNGVHVKQVSVKNNKIELEKVLHDLYTNFSVMNIMVEAGSTLNGAFIDEKLADAVTMFIAPKIIGSKDAMTSIAGIGVDVVNDATQFVSINCCKSGDDICIKGVINKYTDEIKRATISNMELNI